MFLPMSSCLAAVANHIFAIHFGPNSIYTYSNWLCVILTQEGMQGNFFEKLTAFASPRLLHWCIECNCAWLYYVHKLYHTLYFFFECPCPAHSCSIQSVCVHVSVCMYVCTYVCTCVWEGWTTVSVWWGLLCLSECYNNTDDKLVLPRL